MAFFLFFPAHIQFGGLWWKNNKLFILEGNLIQFPFTGKSTTKQTVIDVKGWKVTKPDSEPLPFEKLVKNNRKEHSFVSVPSNGVKPQTVIDVKAWRVKTPAQPPDTFETLVKKNRKESFDEIARANLARDEILNMLLSSSYSQVEAGLN